MKTNNKSKKQKQKQPSIRSLALAHLRGISGGLRGVVRDLSHGASITQAVGLGDSWDLPDGVDPDAVENEVYALTCELIDRVRSRVARGMAPSDAMDDAVEAFHDGER